MPIASPELDLDSIEKLREEELDEARAIQSGMLPTQPLRVGGITISHEFQPAALVGDDYLDYFSLPDHMIDMYVGDVSGKGRPAAMYAALAVGTLRGIHNTGQHPTQVMALLNRRRNARAFVAAGRRMSSSEGCGNPSRSISRNQP